MPNPASPARTFYNEANDLLYMDIRYDQLLGISGTSGTIQKAGNISQIAWRARGRETQIYSYGYDYLSRLTTSTYYNYSDAAVVSGTNNYNENLSYDLRGNIQTLQRTGFYTNASTCTFGQIDNLTYSYTANTNRLHKVLDATVTAGDAKSRGFNGLLSTVDNSMTYDANGNLIKNLHKNVSSISYNHLNLPTVITFTTGNTIEFLYDAGGSKLRKTVKVGGVVQYAQDYLGGIEYRQTGAGAKRIESIFHTEGRYYNTNVDVSNTAVWRKEYNFKDHLGNTRLVFTDRNGNGVVDITGTASTSDVLQENHYYAFGMAFEGAWLQNDASIRDNKYQYNGKEINEDFGLNWMDYGARWYDAAIGRWNGVDPFAIFLRDDSPYSYVAGNPVNGVDIMGLFPSSLNKDQEESFTSNSPNTHIANDKYYDPNGELVLEIENDQPDRHFTVVPDNGNWLVTGEVNSAPGKRGIGAVRSRYWDAVDNSLNITDPFWGGAEYQLGQAVGNRLLYTSYPLRNKSIALNGINPTRLKTPFGSLKVNTKLAFKTVKALKFGGAILGGAGIIMSGTELIDGILRGDNSAMLKGGLGIAAGILGFAGPVGLGVSVAYTLFVEPRLFPDE